MEFHLHITGPDFSQDFLIPEGETIIGREAGSGLQLANPLISRRHARIVCTLTECSIADLGSANGTIVNGNKLSLDVPMPLADQSQIAIGPFELTCSVIGSPQSVSVGQSVVERSVLPSAGVEEPAPEVKIKKAEPKPPAPRSIAKPEAKKKPSSEERIAAPPVPQTPPPAPPAPKEESLFEPDESRLPPGQLTPAVIGPASVRLINYLPGIYHTDFMSRFLALFESILIPIEWNVSNFDLYLDPSTSPSTFLPWLANWYEIVFDASWNDTQRRTLLEEAHQIYSRRGTRFALSRVLEIYTGHKPEILEFTNERDPFTFTVRLAIRSDKANRELIEQLIDTSKPAYTSYKLEFVG